MICNICERRGTCAIGLSSAPLRSRFSLWPSHFRRLWQPRGPDLIDINRATISQLKMLPGIRDAWAEAIVKNRPYKNKTQLLTRKILPLYSLQAIKDQIIAKHKRAGIFLTRLRHLRSGGPGFRGWPWLPLQTPAQRPLRKTWTRIRRHHRTPISANGPAASGLAGRPQYSGITASGWRFFPIRPQTRLLRRLRS